MRSPSASALLLVLAGCAGAPLPPGVDPYAETPLAPQTLEALVRDGLAHPFRVGDPLYVRSNAATMPFERRRLEPVPGIYLVWQRGRSERAEVVQVAFPDERQLTVAEWQQRTGLRLGDTIAWLQNPACRNRARMSQMHVSDIRHPVPCLAVDGATFFVVVRSGKVDSLVWCDALEALQLIEGEPAPALLVRTEAAVAAADLPAARELVDRLMRVVEEAPTPPSWNGRAAAVQTALQDLERRARHAAVTELAQLVATAGAEAKDAPALTQIAVYARHGATMLDLVARAGADLPANHSWHGYRMLLGQAIAKRRATVPEDSAEALLLAHLGGKTEWPAPTALGAAVAAVRTFDAADEFRAAMDAMWTLRGDGLQIGKDTPAQWQRALAMVADRAAAAWRAAERPLSADYLAFWAQRLRTTRLHGNGPGIPRGEQLDAYTASLGSYPHTADVATRRAWLEQCKLRTRDANGNIDQFSLDSLVFVGEALRKL